jgi:Crp-like helix-turn-helix domain
MSSPLTASGPAASLGASPAFLEVEGVAELLARQPSQAVAAHALRRSADFANAVLLVLTDGFVVVRTVPAPPSRPVITCEAAQAGLLMPPASDEVLEAVLDSTLVPISLEAYEALVEVPGVARMLLRDIQTTLRRKQDTLAIFGNIRHADRLRRKLVLLAAEHGRVTSAGVRVELALTHELLARMIGSERETVTRALEELERNGLVARDGRAYILQVNPEELRQ